MGINVILSPHLDDAVISCFSQIQSDNVIIINIFAGVPKKSTKTTWDLVCGQLNSVKMMEKRRLENNHLMQSLNIKSIDLDYLDYQYRNSLVNLNEIMNHILTISPPEATFFVPLALGSLYRHPDHVITRNIGLAILERHQKVNFYADQPYMKVSSINKNYRQKLTKKIETKLRLTGKIISSKLNLDQQNSKLTSMKAYRSQFSMVNLMSLGALSKKNNLKQELIFEPKI